MESKSPSLIAIGAVVAIFLGIAMTVAGPGSRLSNGWNYLTTGNQVQTITGNPQALADGSTDYRSLARADAINSGIDPDLFERQINQESGFNPSALSPMNAEGIAQIEPDTAKGWHVDPWNPVASLQAAAKAMAWYQSHYGSFEKSLAAYNAGTSSLDSALARCGSAWRTCIPAETQRYISAIMGN